MKNIVIIGAGPRGIGALGMLFEELRKTGGLEVTVHLINNGPFGASSPWDPTQPDTNVMNTRCNDAIAYDKTQTLYGYSYNTISYLERQTVLPRSALGKFLQHSYSHLSQNVPPGVTFKPIQGVVVDIDYKEGGGPHTVHLEDGRMIVADKVLIVTGHSTHEPTEAEMDFKYFARRCRKEGKEVFYHHAYPVQDFLAPEIIPEKSRVGILGLGLSSIDMIIGLTKGRGGKFRIKDGVGFDLEYLPSGREPQLYAWTLGGIPLSTKPELYRSPSYVPQYFTRKLVDEWLDAGVEKNFNEEILPIILEEMKYEYYRVKLHKDPQTEGEIAEFKESIKDLDGIVLENWTQPLCCRTYETSEDFHKALVEWIGEDIKASDEGYLQNPIKGACGALTTIKSHFEHVVNYGTLVRPEHLPDVNYFEVQYRQLATGPPVDRMREVFALIKAGVLDISIGPDPIILRNYDKWCFQLQSRPEFITQEEKTIDFEYFIDPRIPTPVAQTDQSPLMVNLLKKEIVSIYENAPGIAVDPDHHVIAPNNIPNPDIFAIGLMTDGCLFYTFSHISTNTNAAVNQQIENWAKLMVKEIESKPKHLKARGKFAKVCASCKVDCKPKFHNETRSSGSTYSHELSDFNYLTPHVKDVYL